jgi:hypothetical protein
MKYIIAESKLDEVITNYLDELFDVKNVIFVKFRLVNEDLALAHARTHTALFLLHWSQDLGENLDFSKIARSNTKIS